MKKMIPLIILYKTDQIKEPTVVMENNRRFESLLCFGVDIYAKSVIQKIDARSFNDARNHDVA